MRSLGHQQADDRDDVQRNKEKDRRWEDREKFFLELLEYLMHGAFLFITDSVVQLAPLTIPSFNAVPENTHVDWGALSQ